MKIPWRTGHCGKTCFNIFAGFNQVFMTESAMSSTERRLYRLAAIVLGWAYFSHLGYVPTEPPSDEGIRSLVSLEMNLSGNYWVPTLNGDIYLNKPPLFNWILALFFKIFGYNAFALRLPTFISIFIGGWIVYKFTRRYLDERTAWTSALFTLVNGRILIYDSLLGLIDITYAWVTILGFMLIFRYGEKKQYAALFLLSYLVAAVGYLMKGFPSLVYQGLTLLAYFTYTRNFKKLFHPWHFAGIFLFLLITGTYYFFYFRQTGLSPEDLFNTLFNESAKRTAVSSGKNELLKHLLVFPLSLFYHFMPPMLFAILLFRKNAVQLIRSHPIILFCAVTFIVNILVYWFSPKIFARYLLTIMPLAFIVFAWAWHKTSEDDPRKKILHWIMLVGVTAIFAACFVLPFHPMTRIVDHAWPRSVFLVIALGLVVYGMWRLPRLRLVLFFLAIAVFRIGFNWFAVEQRTVIAGRAALDGEKIAAITKGQPLYIYGSPMYEYYGSSMGDKNTTSFNIARHRQEILRFKKDIRYDAFYLTSPGAIDSIPHRVYYEFSNPGVEKAVLVKFTPAP